MTHETYDDKSNLSETTISIQVRYMAFKMQNVARRDGYSPNSDEAQGAKEIAHEMVYYEINWN